LRIFPAIPACIPTVFLVLYVDMKASDENAGCATLEEAVEAFASAARGPFTTDEAAGWIESRMTALPARLGEAVDALLEQSEWLFTDFENDVHVPRHTFFEGAHFLMSPTSEEIEKGVLIAGHRFVPFVFAPIFPAHCRLLIGGEQPLEMTTVSWGLGDLGIYFSLYGWRAMTEYLLSDIESNAEALMSAASPEDVEVSLTAFDMAGLYRDLGFKVGDGLLCTVRNWTRGEFAVEHVTSETLGANGREQRRWCRGLEEALLDVFDTDGPLFRACEQLARAFFHGPDVLIRSAPLHIGGFLADTDVLEMKPMPHGTILWHADEDPADLVDLMPDPTQMPATGRCDSLAAILAELALALTDTEIEAYMLDELARGDASLDAVLNRCLAGREELVFYDERQEEAFVHLIGELWHTLGVSYDAKLDAPRAPIRAAVLEAVDRHLEWMRTCDRNGMQMEDLPVDRVAEMGSIVGFLTQILKALGGDDITEEQVFELNAHVATLVARLDELLEAVRQEPSVDDRPHLRLLPFDDDPRSS